MVDALRSCFNGTQLTNSNRILTYYGENLVDMG